MITNAQTILFVTLFGLVTVAAVIDWRSRRIPNVLSFGGIFFGIILQTVLFGFDGIQTALGGCAVGFILLLPGYALNQLGAGDVKLMAAAGTFMGPLVALIATLISMMVGAVYALVLVFLSRGTGPWQRYGNMLRCLFVTGKTAYEKPQSGEAMARSFPYGFAIAIGSLVAVTFAGMGIVS